MMRNPCSIVCVARSRRMNLFLVTLFFLGLLILRFRTTVMLRLDVENSIDQEESTYQVVRYIDIENSIFTAYMCIAYMMKYARKTTFMVMKNWKNGFIKNADGG